LDEREVAVQILSAGVLAGVEGYGWGLSAALISKFALKSRAGSKRVLLTLISKTAYFVRGSLDDF
jgi:hypothetical protein